MKRRTPHADVVRLIRYTQGDVDTVLLGQNS
jgi:hypothetical protein